jgi:DUF971 family protein
MTQESAAFVPSKIILHKLSRTLELEYATGESLILPCSYLRAFSPSAEMRDQPRNPQDFQRVNILSIEPVGQYAIKPIFSDGHRTGIFSFNTLYELGMNFKNGSGST